MAIQDTDLFLVNESGLSYQITADKLKEILSSGEWILVPSADNTRKWNCITYGDNKFVAGATDQTNQINIMTSTDGISWVNAGNTVIAKDQFGAIAYGNNVFVGTPFSSLSGNNRLKYSSDGVNWEPGISIPVSGYASRSIAFGVNIFVIAAGRDRLDRTTNGLNFYNISAGNSNADWNGVAYGDGKFVIVGNGSRSTWAGYSSDGVNWTITSPPALAGSNWYDVAYGNGKFIAVALYGNHTTAISENGVDWSLGPEFPGENWRSISYGGGEWIAVSQLDQQFDIATSTDDGATWEFTKSPANPSWQSLAYGDGKMVAVGTAGTDDKVMYKAPSSESTSGAMLVNRNSVSYRCEIANLKNKVLDTDIFLVNRDGQSYRVSGLDFKNAIL